LLRLYKSWFLKLKSVLFYVLNEILFMIQFAPHFEKYPSVAAAAANAGTAIEPPSNPALPGLSLASSDHLSRVTAHRRARS
jgi:hypothetical protein